MTTQTYAPAATEEAERQPAEAGREGRSQGAPVAVVLDGRTVELEGAAAAAVRDVLGHFDRGEGVFVGGVDELLTTVKAAELMGVSRSHVCNLMDRDELPFRHVGTHRRVRVADVMAHIERQRAVTRKSLDDIADVGHQSGLYPDDV
ncbi:helix-turn-helix domain-containing protein [Kytococcus sedentarius]|uniref:helix-turn-helix domain-containing protein n=1 Tax=Kytococcus sedentarius TaxID=1276 RepID=UPI00387A4510